MKLAVFVFTLEKDMLEVPFCSLVTAFAEDSVIAE